MIPLTAPSKTWVCGRSPAGIAGSNPAGGMDVLSLVLSGRGLCDGPHHSSRGVLPSVECLNECDLETSTIGLSSCPRYLEATPAAGSRFPWSNMAVATSRVVQTCHRPTSSRPTHDFLNHRA